MNSRKTNLLGWSPSLGHKATRERAATREASGRPTEVRRGSGDRSETGEPGKRLRIVPAPGGAAFVEDGPAEGRR